MSEEKQPTIEEGFAQLEQIIRELEGPDVPLEQAFALYQRGIGTLRQCSEQLDLVEKKLLVLNAGGTLEEM